MPSPTRIANPDYSPTDKQKTTVAALTLGALGVVYGDIGTSPLYALKEVFSPATGVLANPDSVIGAVSVVLWALILNVGCLRLQQFLGLIAFGIQNSTKYNGTFAHW
jgi:K+ transporter